MLLYGPPILFACFAWWFLTGAVLYVIGLPRKNVAWSMTAATVVLGAAFLLLWQVSGETAPAAAYQAFFAALLVWGWHEMSFLTGKVTGPRTSEAPAHPNGRARFWPAVETLLYHELAILVTGLALLALLWGSANEVGLWTFVILWLMRISAKLNVYLGVPNVTEEFLPTHLSYLKSYFCRRAMNLLFPVSVTLSTVATVLLGMAAINPAATDFEATGYTLLATLMALAVIEHWFLVVPLPSAALWSWGLASREKSDPAHRLPQVPAAQQEAPIPVSATIF